MFFFAALALLLTASDALAEPAATDAPDAAKTAAPDIGTLRGTLERGEVLEVSD